MAATRKDFEAVAEQIKAEIEKHDSAVNWAEERGLDRTAMQERSARVAVCDLAYRLADVFEGLNPSFARRRFFLAAGVFTEKEV